MSPSVQAMPSFSRQTGSACIACHTTAFGPNLTPYGRDFKLNGYVWGNDQKEGYVPPISAIVMGSFTNTRKDIQPNPASQDGTPNHFNTNNNFTFDQASLFYAGRIWDKVGAFSQLPYNGVADSLAMDNTDVRFANRVDVFGQDVVYGISANNKPTVQDLWNTTSAWGFPYNVAPFGLGGPSASAMLAGGLGGVG
ncbi:MAG: cytochrome C, partial [Methylococcaceae bacterium]|nr:cytochrome C [Methylococcaceae bacterium]